MKNCKTIEIDGVTAIVCGTRSAPSCHKCMKVSKFQCDFPIGKYKNGKMKTCSKHLCFDHAKHGITPGVDFCEDHYITAKLAYERRMQKPIGGKE